MVNNIIVTTALCYSNGPLHLGHMLEQIQADIWVRFLRTQNRNCIFLSGEDAHGTPIMLAAKKKGVATEDYIKTIKEDHLRDIQGFQISFDHYHSTHSEENKAICEAIYARIPEYIEKRSIDQYFDEQEGMFLPDRFIKGTCPKCHAQSQYGDSCEQCGSHYSPTELIDPVSTLSNTKPIIKQSEHLFFKLSKQQSVIKDWLLHADMQPEAKNKLSEWTDEPLRDWDISRDAPYFGFKIPEYDNKFFYVWLDAPIGYIGTLSSFCQQNNESLESLWWEKTQSEIYHFVGKDILYFHGIFWPAVLSAAGIQTPSGIFSHGFLTVNKEKMSKSKGTFITAKDYLSVYPSDALRYYFASKINASIEDIDIHWEDFAYKVNSDVVGKIVNIGSRCAQILVKHFDGHLTIQNSGHTLLDQMNSLFETIEDGYHKRMFNQVTKTIAHFADLTNQHIAEIAPWQLIKNGDRDAAQHTCSLGVIIFAQLIAFLSPIMPHLAQQTFDYLSVPLDWRVSLPTDLQLTSFPRLFERIDPSKIKDLCQ
ncbi:MAG: methionine--tRNA ligase [Legionellales bacterium]|nr:methionine--tRNA ligase [Legionellales bacterium]